MEMARDLMMMDKDGTHVGVEANGSADGRPNYLDFVWLLREKLTDLINGNVAEPPGLGLQRILDLASSDMAVFHDLKLMFPSLWMTLPRELLLLVLARLPLPEITRLRCLSKEWKTSMDTIHSEFNQACDEANPNMVAYLSSYRYSDHEFFVRIFDLRKNRWHAYIFYLGDMERTWKMMDTCNGGLVCFISTWKPEKDDPICILVMNPLTRVQHVLPPLHDLWDVPPTVLEITVDYKTKCYKVLFVGKREGCLLAEIYDSRLRQWTRAPQAAQSLDVIFGHAHEWMTDYDGNFFSRSRAPCAYDFADGQLEVYSENDPSKGAHWYSRSSTLMKDRMFVLHEEMQDRYDCEMLSQAYCIREHQAQNNAKDWVQVKTHRCTPLEHPLKRDYRIDLYASEGILMVFARHQSPRPYLPEIGWLLDLSTGEWRDLPKCPDQEDQPIYSDSLMCQVHWNLIP